MNLRRNIGGGGATRSTPGRIINNLTGKPLCVYNRLQRLSGGFRSAIQRFDGEFPVSHLRLNMAVPINTNANASTSLPSNYVITIKINPNKLNRPNLSIARTIIHETIHAEMFRKLLSLAKRRSIGRAVNVARINGLKDNYPGLFDYYVRHGGQQGTGHNPAQHNQMAQHYRTTMVNMLKQFEPGHPQSLYEALAWVGLHNTTAWNNLSASERSRIRSSYRNFDRRGTENCN